MATIAAVVLAATGATATAVAVVSQKHPPRPSLSAAGLPVPTTGIPPAPEAGAPPNPAVALPPSEPVAIDIPAIGVHSKVHSLGLTPSGALEVPAGPLYNQAAWYKYSPTPGSLGPAIISGHVDSAKDGPSVFFRLGDLKPGDQIMVTRSSGLIATFRVDRLGVYPKVQFPTKLVYGDTDHPALRLLTCGGPFDRSAGHYVDNIVVFASLI